MEGPVRGRLRGSPGPAVRRGSTVAGQGIGRPCSARAARSSSSGGSESSRRGSSSRSVGPAMNVVTSAITTSIVKSAGEIIPRLRPMLRTISSVSPRVFMRAPIAAESRTLKPLYFAASIAPSHLPAIATPMRSKQRSHRTGRLSRPTSVLRPVTTKKSGSSTATTKSSKRPRTSSVRPAFRGMINPVRKAPKMAAIPICCETKAESRTPTKMIPSQTVGTRPTSS